MPARRSLPVALAAVCVALLACSAAAPAGGMAGEIAFLSTLPSWPPPENLGVAQLYSGACGS